MMALKNNFKNEKIYEPHLECFCTWDDTRHAMCTIFISHAPPLLIEDGIYGGDRGLTQHWIMYWRKFYKVRINTYIK